MQKVMQQSMPRREFFAKNVVTRGSSTIPANYYDQYVDFSNTNILASGTSTSTAYTLTDALNFK